MSTTEDLVADALREARTDPRFAVSPASDAAWRVRRAATAARRRVTALAVAAVTVTGGAGTAAALHLPAQGGGESVLRVGGVSGGAPVPGISPPWRPRSGLDWLLADAAYRRFVADHTTPSPAPHTVTSPARLTAVSARLLADVRGALPSETELLRQDAPDGEAGAAAVHATMPDGTPVEVQQRPLGAPIDYETWWRGATEGPWRGATQGPRLLATGSAYVAAAQVGYGWAGRAPDGARAVLMVTPSGEVTTWYAPLSVPLREVIFWATYADAHAAGATPDARDLPPATGSATPLPGPPATATPALGTATPVPGTAASAAGAAASAAAGGAAAASGGTSATPTTAFSPDPASAAGMRLRAAVLNVVRSTYPTAVLLPDAATDAQAVVTVGHDHVTVARFTDTPRALTLRVRYAQGSGFGIGNEVTLDDQGMLTRWFATEGIPVSVLVGWAKALGPAPR